MPHDFTIPQELSHLRLDERGFPIPFFVPMVKDKPEFRYKDRKKIEYCIAKRRCSICGKKLRSQFSYVITGPMGLKNRIVSDAPMHLLCAQFTMEACPYIHFERTKRIDNRDGGEHVIKTKPERMFLIKIDGYEVIRDPHNTYFKFNVVSFEEYRYNDGILKINSAG